MMLLGGIGDELNEEGELFRGGKNSYPRKLEGKNSYPSRVRFAG